jgi:type II secretory pathway pseudopilin PulG
VVIAIIGILVALLLPAVQAVREAARRTECKSNLRQQALALNLFHDAKGHYPPGRAGSPRFPTGTEQHAVSWAFYLLPFVEQQSQFDTWKPTERCDDPANAVAMQTPVATFYCPSRRAPAADRDFDNNGAPSLAPSSGAGGDYAANAGLSTRNGMGEYGRKRFNGESFGPIYTNSALSSRRVADGLSKTFAIGEKFLPPEPSDLPDGLRHAAQGDTAFFAGDNRHGAVRRSSAGFPESRNETYRGHFGSEHAELAHFAFLDGSVRVLLYDTDQESFEWLSVVADGQQLPDEIFED